MLPRVVCYDAPTPNRARKLRVATAVTNENPSKTNPMLQTNTQHTNVYMLIPNHLTRRHHRSTLTASNLALVRLWRAPPSDDHLVHDLVVLRALVRPDRLAVVRDVVYAEPAVEADLAVARVRSARHHRSIPDILRCERWMKHVPAPAETEPHALHASAVLGDCITGQIGRARAIAWKRTMAVPVRDDFHFSRASAGSVVALSCLQQPLVEEAVLPLRVAGLL